MALHVAAASASSVTLRIVFTNSSSTQLFSNVPLRRPAPLRTLHVTSAKKFTSRTGRFNRNNRRGAVTTKEQDEDQSGLTQEISEGHAVVGKMGVSLSEDGAANVNVSALSDLPGLQPDFWEGPQWDALGLFVQYMWAFGIVFALIACGIAVATYNEGATDFKQTPAYKESIQSQDLLEEPEASNSDVFESNPTEVAPSLE